MVPGSSLTEPGVENRSRDELKDEGEDKEEGDPESALVLPVETIGELKEDLGKKDRENDHRQKQHQGVEGPHQEHDGEPKLFDESLTEEVVTLISQVFDGGSLGKEMLGPLGVLVHEGA